MTESGRLSAETLAKIKARAGVLYVSRMAQQTHVIDRDRASLLAHIEALEAELDEFHRMFSRARVPASFLEATNDD